VLCFQVNAEVSLDTWLVNAEVTAQKQLRDNINPTGTQPGVVVASPSKSDPDYWFHWVRDAALSMDIVLTNYKKAEDLEVQKSLENLLINYIDFSKRNQVTSNPTGQKEDSTFRLLGEPKFNVDGSAFEGNWGRPQFDSPALRVITLVKLAKFWIERGRKADVLKLLYQPELPAKSVIKRDLECLYYHAMEPGFDLWEESLGEHFYTHVVQRRALLDGADLADALGDPGAANEYRRIANKVEQRLRDYWSEDKKIIRVTLNPSGGAMYKKSEIDAAVVLGILHGYKNDNFMPFSDSQVLSTVHQTELAFQAIYPINKISENLGTAIGRYPEDKYDGASTDKLGNPWFLITAGFGEFYYRLAKELKEKKSISINSNNFEFYQSLKIPNIQQGRVLRLPNPQFSQAISRIHERGDSYLSRVKYHSPDGRLPEQFNRDNGFKQSAADLTWSYAALLTAVWQR
jgi:glucoamylase